MNKAETNIKPKWQFDFNDDLPEGKTLEEFDKEDKESVIKEAQIWSTNGAGNLPNGFHVLKK